MPPVFRTLRATVRLLTTAGWSTLVTGALLTALGVGWGHGETLVVGATLLGVVVLALAWMIRRPALEATRTVEPTRLEEGVDARAVVRVSNAGQRRSPWVSGLDQVNGRTVQFALSPVDPGHAARQTYPVPTNHRGVYELGPLTISHVDPFHLMRAGSVLGGRASYRVWPRAEVVPPLPTGRVRDLEGSATPRTAGSGITFHNLREYVPGDDLRQIHWRSTARTGTLLVRQNVLTSEPRMAIFVDCRAEAYDTDQRFDDVCRVAASLLQAGVRGKNPVELMASTGQLVGVDAAGARFEQALDVLASVQRSDDDTGLVQLARLTDRRHAAASIAVITGDVSPGGAELLGALRPRYASFTAVQIGTPAYVRTLPLSASTTILAGNVHDFAVQWGRRFNR